MATVKLEWQRKTADQKLTRGAYILQQMALNASAFATPNPALETVDEAISDLRKKNIAALAGGYALTFAKNEAEKALDVLINQLAAYVQNVSGGNEGIILLSGMEVRKTPSPLPDPEQVQNLDAYPTRTSGRVKLNWDRLEHVSNYQVEVWETDDKADGFWAKKGTPSKSQMEISGLVTGTVYRFRVAGIGKNDVLGAFSQDASSVAP
ncbi:MAG: fibronectin type III domain-containing protein [Flavobacteriales bacterium]